MQHVPLLPQHVGHLFDVPRIPLAQHHFRAHMFVQMHVCGRQHQVVAVMLEMRQLPAQLPRLMVINQCNCPHDFLVALPLLLNSLSRSKSRTNSDRFAYLLFLTSLSTRSRSRCSIEMLNLLRLLTLSVV